MKDREKERIATPGCGPARNDGAGGKTPPRYVYRYCAACRKKLEGLGYILTETGRAAAWRNCGLCGSFALITPTDLFKPPKRYRYRTGAGERERAGRR